MTVLVLVRSANENVGSSSGRIADTEQPVIPVPAPPDAAEMPEVQRKIHALRQSTRSLLSKEAQPEDLIPLLVELHWILLERRTRLETMESLSRILRAQEEPVLLRLLAAFLLGGYEESAAVGALQTAIRGERNPEMLRLLAVVAALNTVDENGTDRTLSSGPFGPTVTCNGKQLREFWEWVLARALRQFGLDNDYPERLRDRYQTATWNPDFVMEHCLGSITNPDLRASLTEVIPAAHPEEVRRGILRLLEAARSPTDLIPVCAKLAADPTQPVSLRCDSLDALGGSREPVAIETVESLLATELANPAGANLRILENSFLAIERQSGKDRMIAERNALVRAYYGALRARFPESDPQLQNLFVGLSTSGAHSAQEMLESVIAYDADPKVRIRAMGNISYISRDDPALFGRRLGLLAHCLAEPGVGDAALASLERLSSFRRMGPDYDWHAMGAAEQLRRRLEACKDEHLRTRYESAINALAAQGMPTKKPDE